jgi:hypothetical protein
MRIGTTNQNIDSAMRSPSIKMPGTSTIFNTAATSPHHRPQSLPNKILAQDEGQKCNWDNYCNNSKTQRPDIGPWSNTWESLGVGGATAIVVIIPIDSVSFALLIVRLLHAA